MPRKNPMPQREREICARLRAFRELKKIPRSTFAKEIGLDQFRLASYELGRAPLRYGLAHLLCSKFNINQRWLATGEGWHGNYYPIDHDPSRNKNGLFSEVYDAFLAARIKEFDRGMEALAEGQEASVVGGAPSNLIKTPAEAASWYVRFLMPYLVGDLPLELVENYIQSMVEAHRTFLAANEERLEELNSATTVNTALSECKPTVDNAKSVNTMARVSSDIPTWKQIVAALKRLTDSPGAKAQLAADLKTSRQNVNKWLSGAGAPSAELTLEVFRWVEDHGGWKQKKL